MISIVRKAKNSTNVINAPVKALVFLWKSHKEKKLVAISKRINWIIEMCNPSHIEKENLSRCSIKLFINFMICLVINPINKAPECHHEKQNKISSANSTKPDKGTDSKLMNRNKSGN